MTAATALLEIISVRMEQSRYRPEMATRHPNGPMLSTTPNAMALASPVLLMASPTHSIPRIRKIMPQSTDW